MKKEFTVILDSGVQFDVTKEELLKIHEHFRRAIEQKISSTKNILFISYDTEENVNMIIDINKISAIIPKKNL